jgi:hypothetical protein
VKRRAGLVGLTIFGALWTAGVAAVDYKYAGAVVEQARTSAFARTEGEITSSGVTTSRSSKGKPLHGVALVYTYAVGRRTFQGTRYRTTRSEESGSAAADVARGFPIGARVPVYYAPDDPSQSVLRPGLSSADAFPALFLFPFNAAAVGLWWALRVQGRRTGDHAPGGLRMVEAGGVTRVFAPSAGAAGAALAWAAFTDFVLTIAVAIKFGFEPPGWAVTGVVALVLAVAALAAWLAARIGRPAGRGIVEGS